MSEFFLGGKGGESVRIVFFILETENSKQIFSDFLRTIHIFVKNETRKVLFLANN